MFPTFKSVFVFRIFFVLLFILATSGCSAPIWPAADKNSNKTVSISEKRDSKEISSQSQLLPPELLEAAEKLFSSLDYKKINFNKLSIKTAFTGKVTKTNRVFVLTEDKKLYLCKAWLNVCAELTGIELGASEIAYEAESERLAIIAKEHYMFIYDLSDASLLRHSNRLRESISSIAFGKDAESILIGTISGQVYHWLFNPKSNLDLFDELTRYSGHGTVVKQVVMHPSNRVFFSVDWQGKLSAWETYEADPYSYSNIDNPFKTTFWAEQSKRIKKQLPGGVNDLILSKDGRYLVMAMADGSIDLWSVRGFEKICSIESPSSPKAMLPLDSWRDILVYNASKAYFFDIDQNDFPDSTESKQECQASFKELSVDTKRVKKFFHGSEDLYVISNDGFKLINR